MVSDESLYERLLGGDMAAFDALYERYERPLFGFIYKQLNDARAAEDVMQDAFLGLLKDRRSLHSFRAWLYHQLAQTVRGAVQKLPSQLSELVNRLREEMST